MTMGLAEVKREQAAKGPSNGGVVPSPSPASVGIPASRAFTGLTRIRSGHEAELTSYLTQLGTNIKTSTDILFSELRLVHFFRWVVIHDTAGQAWLAFESNYDDSPENHFAELVRVGASGIHAIYRHCEGYPCEQAGAIAAGDEAAVVSFLCAQSIDYAAFHVGVHNKTADRIRKESEIRNVIESFVDERRASGAWSRLEPEAMYSEILAHLGKRGLLADAQQKQPPPPASRVFPWLVRAAPVALLLVPFVIPLYVLLRIREATDEQDEIRVAPANIRKLAEREDFQVQNQLTHIVDVKPGLFRAGTLRLVLWAIDLLARYQFNQGALGGITTIHFARWAFVDGGKRLLFFSNYDGSWESYLGDFIDKASSGLTGVWSNTKGFPRTKNLVDQGATDEERFKSWTRAGQLPTQLWYTAYPELTVFNIKQNATVCAGLAEKPATREAMLAWLQSL